MFGTDHPTLTLKRNLRRSILRGSPWVYADSLAAPAASTYKASLAKLLDSRGEFLAWVLLDPHSVLRARVLSLEPSPPTLQDVENKILKALALRSSLLSKSTNAVRLLHGEGDLMPGLVIDKYAEVGVLQTDGQGPREFWLHPHLTELFKKTLPVKTLVEKPRRGSGDEGLRILYGDVPERLEILENGARFGVPLAEGQKTGFFLDQRDNRLYAGPFCRGKSVLNAFSYTGGFSIFAGLGGASHVTSLDISQGALDEAHQNWKLNGLKESQHEILCEDAFKFLQNTRQQWDVLFVDPPSMTHSKSQKEKAAAKYIEVFSSALKRVHPGGDIFLSSCSSHIGSKDFLDIIEEALSTARRTGRYLRLSSQGPDHPFPHFARELQYLKFAHLTL